MTTIAEQLRARADLFESGEVEWVNRFPRNPGESCLMLDHPKNKIGVKCLNRELSRFIDQNVSVFTNRGAAWNDIRSPHAKQRVIRKLRRLAAKAEKQERKKTNPHLKEVD